jgi:two-component system chemotaxis response regulator CheB
VPELVEIEQELIRKVHTIRELRIDKVRERLHAMPPAVQRRHHAEPARAPGVVVIGSSTGGPAALMQIFGAFPEASACPFLVAQHMPEDFTRGFAERLDRLTPFRAVEARGGERPAPGTILVAPGGSHLELEGSGDGVFTRVVPHRGNDKYTPSVDRLFESAAKCYGGDVLAVVLTGMGDDGRKGVRAVKNAGGTVIAESEETAVIFGMPQQAIRTGVVDQVLALGDIATAIEAGIGSKNARAAIRKGRV